MVTGIIYVWYYDTLYFAPSYNSVASNGQKQDKSIMNRNLLDALPDPQGMDFDALLCWVNARVEAIRQTAFTPDLQNTFACVTLDTLPEHPLGVEALASWRKFFLATLVADWVSYGRPSDRADFSRLKYIMSSAYRTTRLWGCRLADGSFAPVGYTTWYPIAQFVFEGVLRHQVDLNDRGIFAPLRFADLDKVDYAYVFNISLVEGLINTPCSKKPILELIRDGVRHPETNVLAVTVAEQGRKFSDIMGFEQAGEITVQGEKELLFVRRAERAHKTKL